jgi:hypothetical protein
VTLSLIFEKGWSLLDSSGYAYAQKGILIPFKMLLDLTLMVLQ